MTKFPFSLHLLVDMHMVYPQLHGSLKCIYEVFLFYGNIINSIVKQLNLVGSPPGLTMRSYFKWMSLVYNWMSISGYIFVS